jgi:hypothetical protein
VIVNSFLGMGKETIDNLSSLTICVISFVVSKLIDDLHFIAVKLQPILQDLLICVGIVTGCITIFNFCKGFTTKKKDDLPRT